MMIKIVVHVYLNIEKRNTGKKMMFILEDYFREIPYVLLSSQRLYQFH